MTIRYLVMAGGPADRRRHLAQPLERVAGLALGLHDDRITVLSSRPLQWPWPTACVIGELHASGARVVPRAPPSADSQVATLLTRFWGRYLAVLRDCRETIMFLRDPSAALACYVRQVDDLVLVASDLDLLDRAVPVRRSLDWQEIASCLVNTDLRLAATAITGTIELLPGTLLTAGPRSITTRHPWLPSNFADRQRGLAAGAQADGLRSCVDTVLDQVAQAHPAVISTVSGGLDSSIVTLGLSARRANITCSTLTCDDPGGDERPFARIVAAAASAPLAEHLLDATAVDLSRSQAAHLPRPIGRPFIRAMASAFYADADRHRAAIVNGTGGDNAFCLLRSATPVVDRWLAEGSLAALRTARDIARLSGASVRDVVVAAVRRRCRSSIPSWTTDRRFLSRDVASDLAGRSHPWLRLSPDDTRPGTAAHLAMLVRIQNYLEPWNPGHGASVVNPLLAQPIVEYCLGIPSWDWCEGGRDRAVARRAFSDLLPPVIRNRTTKGGPDAFICALAERNRPLLRTALVDGLLAGRGLLDRAAILAALDSPAPLAPGPAMRLLLLGDAEAWVRSMS